MLARQRLPYRLWRKVGPSDVVQITLEEAHAHRGQFAGTSEKQLLAWLHPMLIHRIYDQIRYYQAQVRNAGLEQPLFGLSDQASARLRTELMATGTSPSGAVMKWEALDRLARALEKLPDDDRCIVELHVFQGLTWPEVASELGRDRFSVMRQFGRALRSLRDDLKDIA
jgi:RNA polymerase sigma-70 factor (ECF subfamily)